MGKRSRLNPFVGEASNLIHRGKVLKKLVFLGMQKPMHIIGGTVLLVAGHKDELRINL